jgi:hypothetical protein
MTKLDLYTTDTTGPAHLSCPAGRIHDPMNTASTDDRPPFGDGG